MKHASSFHKNAFILSKSAFILQWQCIIYRAAFTKKNVAELTFRSCKDLFKHYIHGIIVTTTFKSYRNRLETF